MADFILKYRNKDAVWITIGHGTINEKAKWESYTLKLYGVPIDPHWDGTLIMSVGNTKFKKT